MRQRPTLTIALTWISLQLTGCGSSMHSLLPQDGPDMAQIYDRHMQQLAAVDPLGLRRERGKRPIHDGETDLHANGRETIKDIDARFPRLPNPTLVMYVYPHLAADEKVPVPGYATSFPMYASVEYALPGEVASRP